MRAAAVCLEGLLQHLGCTPSALMTQELDKGDGGLKDWRHVHVRVLVVGDHAQIRRDFIQKAAREMGMDAASAGCDGQSVRVRARDRGGRAQEKVERKKRGRRQERATETDMEDGPEKEAQASTDG